MPIESFYCRELNIPKLKLRKTIRTLLYLVVTMAVLHSISCLK